MKVNYKVQEEDDFGFAIYQKGSVELDLSEIEEIDNRLKSTYPSKILVKGFKRLLSTRENAVCYLPPCKSWSAWSKEGIMADHNSDFFPKPITQETDETGAIISQDILWRLLERDKTESIFLGCCTGQYCSLIGASRATPCKYCEITY